jgi:DNA adenine methylase
MNTDPAAPTRPSVRYFGGKWALAPWIISYFPDHANYLEPFCGACSVLLQKPRCAVETVNDLDSHVHNFFRTLREHRAELIEKIKYTPLSREEYQYAYDHRDEGDNIERARLFWVLCNQSIRGGPNPNRRGWRLYQNGKVLTPSSNDWGAELDKIADRLRGVQIENDAATSVIRRYDNKDTLLYVDPPYVFKTRTNSKIYKGEMDDQAHRDLADKLVVCKGMVVLSGYANPLYAELYEDRGWVRYDKDAHTSGSNRRESIWLSPHTIKALEMPVNLRLF